MQNIIKSTLVLLMWWSRCMYFTYSYGGSQWYSSVIRCVSVCLSSWSFNPRLTVAQLIIVFAAATYLLTCFPTRERCGFRKHLQRHPLNSLSYRIVSNMAATNKPCAAGDMQKNGDQGVRKIALVTGITGQVRISIYFFSVQFNIANSIAYNHNENRKCWNFIS